ncbi:hypothetical protein EG831_03715 [bacterium]|nr:hypothetical protein [bacterium]
MINIRTICLLALLAAGPAAADPVTIAGGTTNDTEGRIIRLSDGRLMAAVGRNPYGRWDTTDVYVSFSADDGASWTGPALAIGAAGDQATIGVLQLPGDTIRLWYGSNQSGTYYRIHTAHSLNGTDWTADGEVALGWAANVNCYDPTVILGPDSSLTMIYRGGSGTAAGAYVAHRPKGGSWDTSRRLVNARAHRPRIMRHADGTYLAAFQRQSGGSTSQIDVFVRRSTDLTVWSDSVRLTTNQNSHDAWCLQVPDSGYVVYYAKYQNAPHDAYNLCRRRSADGLTWQAEQQLTFDGGLMHNTQPCLFVHAGGLYRCWTRANDYDNDNDVLFERFPLGATGVASVEFTAAWDGAGVGLRWRSACETGCYCWTIERSDGGGPYREIARLPAAGARGEGAGYSHADRAVRPGGAYAYRLVQVGVDGSRDLFGPALVRVPVCPVAGRAMVGHCPNPARARVVFSIALPSSGPARLDVYNAAGQRAATVIDGPMTAGEHRVEWRGRNDSGMALASGIYEYQLTTDSGEASGRLVLLR